MIKAVWICHFTNHIVQDQLQLLRKVPEFAPWISLGIKEATERQDIELHIISPHQWISKDYSFIDKNIHYHFFNPGIPFIGRHWPAFFPWDIITNYRQNKKRVFQIIQKVKPDLIHLHGFENSYYSSTIFQFKDKFPILITVQGFISLQLKGKRLSLEQKKKLKIEIQILKAFKNFGVRTTSMKNEIAKYNKDANFYWHEYFTNIDSNMLMNSVLYNYDIIFFANITKEKGVEDLIIATGKLLVSFPNLRVAIIGRAKPAYMFELELLAEINQCKKNIEFIGFLPIQKDIYKYLAQSKICVLPTYNDTLPSTIIESMFRKVPVVSYNVGGISEISQMDKNLLIVEPGMIDDLVDKIKILLENEDLRIKIANNAFFYATQRWDNKNAFDQIVKIYHTIINDEFQKF